MDIVKVKIDTREYIVVGPSFKLVKYKGRYKKVRNKGKYDIKAPNGDIWPMVLPITDKLVLAYADITYTLIDGSVTKTV